jgi:probable H4MPT-linked C1 transfer pathway protein
MSWIGLDIGGANLKIADGCGWAQSDPFALWRDPGGLSDKLCKLLDAAPAANRLAVTMTGELCDAFRTKADGVQHIVAAVRAVAGARQIFVYAVDGRFVAVDEAESQTDLVAASNWHALATFVCRFTHERTGVLIDIGSTTTDIVPLDRGTSCPAARNDSDRLLAGELMYMGVSRTPICALTARLPWRGSDYPVAAEFFATTADAYLLLGNMAEQRDANSTADGRPLTAEFAAERLGRMICADRTSFSRDDAVGAAEFIRAAQTAILCATFMRVIAKVGQPIETVVTSGAGEFLARRVVRNTLASAKIISLATEMGPAVSCCAPAHALAVLAREEFGP